MSHTYKKRIDEAYWMKKFTALGAFWHHDGNPKRPYARLTSGKISNGFFNGGLVTSRPQLLADIVRTLVKGVWVDGGLRVTLQDALETNVQLQHPFATLTVGPAMGGITFASRLAEQLEIGTTFAEKLEDNHGEFALKRLPPQHPPTSRILLTEDTITSGKSVEAVRRAALRDLPGVGIFPIVAAICNRSGESRLPSGLLICALIDCHMPTWDEGSNPFTPDGAELVPPVRPKTHWIDLTKEY